MQIFHISTTADWRIAQATGSYTTSTYGRTLAEEGFIHASRRDQVRGVFSRFYRDVREPLVLLTVDTDLLDVPWREDQVGEDRFPHIYGPLSPNAVVRVQPLDRDGTTGSLTAHFMREMAWRMALGLLAMLLAGVGAVVASQLAPSRDSSAFVGAIAGLLVGCGVAILLTRLRALRETRFR